MIHEVGDLHPSLADPSQTGHYSARRVLSERHVGNIGGQFLGDSVDLQQFASIGGVHSTLRP